MKCGVRFCGGCNPRYDRGALYRRIKEDLADIDFQYAQEGEVYDCLLVIGGCGGHCASYSQFHVKGEIVDIWDENQINAAEEKLRAAMSVKNGGI
ncbi:MAG TPA: hypothetical protein IAC50_06365 [Candidatus Copromorpha excrementigallinarum]|uniref:Uncharacterized protein n=1 Tax=Candidatus Allocopromorpha excrementigallinarum TaxID=2840742 RepID=A0A9D1I391_9FIRM|nr:hypothetical protein [Candidatus Copromorpha excrementigallinarum]